MGGVLAKDLAMRTGHPGIPFLSTPVFVTIGRKQASRLAILTTNIYNLGLQVGGLFGVERRQAGTNSGIAGNPDMVRSDRPHLSSCNLTEHCGYHRQFEEYCTAAIGADKLAEIRELSRTDVILRTPRFPSSKFDK
jgi:hypothetical protein